MCNRQVLAQRGICDHAEAATSEVIELRRRLRREEGFDDDSDDG